MTGPKNETFSASNRWTLKKISQKCRWSRLHLFRTKCCYLFCRSKLNKYRIQFLALVSSTDGSGAWRMTTFTATRNRRLKNALYGHAWCASCAPMPCVYRHNRYKLAYDIFRHSMFHIDFVFIVCVCVCVLCVLWMTVTPFCLRINVK